LCDNAAVNWSEYSSHISNIEYEVRQKISQELLKHMTFLQKNSAPECHIQGVEQARVFILQNKSDISDKETLETQERLF
jgi:hypothetical protein